MNVNINLFSTIKYIINQNMFKQLYSVYHSHIDIWKIPGQDTTSINHLTSAHNNPFGNSLFVFRLINCYSQMSPSCICVAGSVYQNLYMSPFKGSHWYQETEQLVLPKVQAWPVMFLFQTGFLSIGIFKKISIFF